MTKPQTAKDLVELYDEYTEHYGRLVSTELFHFINWINSVYLDEQTEVVKEDDWDDHKPQSVAVEFAPQPELDKECTCRSYDKSGYDEHGGYCSVHDPTPNIKKEEI